jgi:hypothetical protein
VPGAAVPKADPEGAGGRATVVLQTTGHEQRKLERRLDRITAHLKMQQYCMHTYVSAGGAWSLGVGSDACMSVGGLCGGRRGWRIAPDACMSGGLCGFSRVWVARSLLAAFVVAWVDAGAQG